MKNKLIIFLLAISLLVPNIVGAVGLGDAATKLGSTGEKAGVNKDTDIASIVGTGINIALSLIGLVFLLLMVYAGYLWMTAQGEEEQVKKAQKIITATIIGLVVVISAFAITAMVIARFSS